MFLAVCRIPWLVAAQHGAEDSQDLASDGDERDLRLLSSVAQALMKGFKDGIAAAGGQGRHVEHATHLGTAAPDAAPTSEDAGVVVVGRQTGKRGDFAP